MKSMFCKMHCDGLQNQTVKIVSSSNDVVNKVKVLIDAEDARELFDECYVSNHLPSEHDFLA